MASIHHGMIIHCFNVSNYCIGHLISAGMMSQLKHCEIKVYLGFTRKKKNLDILVRVRVTDTVSDRFHFTRYFT